MIGKPEVVLVFLFVETGRLMDDGVQVIVVL
jgi:hypothetical protein